jgi:ankyrin repeat protein
MSTYPDFSSGNLVLTIKRWLENDGSPHAIINECGESFLHVAAEHADVGAIEYLFALGCDLNVRAPDGIKPLHIAIDYEIDGSNQTGKPLDFKATKRLIELGAELTIQDN